MEQFLDLLLGPAGVTVMALLILFGGYKGWWVYGPTHQEVKREKDEWKEIAMRGTKIAEIAATVLHENGGK